MVVVAKRSKFNSEAEAYAAAEKILGGSERRLEIDIRVIPVLYEAQAWDIAKKIMPVHGSGWSRLEEKRDRRRRQLFDGRDRY